MEHKFIVIARWQIQTQTNAPHTQNVSSFKINFLINEMFSSLIRHRIRSLLLYVHFRFIIFFHIPSRRLLSALMLYDIELTPTKTKNFYERCSLWKITAEKNMQFFRVISNSRPSCLAPRQAFTASMARGGEGKMSNI